MPTSRRWINSLVLGVATMWCVFTLEPAAAQSPPVVPVKNVTDQHFVAITDAMNTLVGTGLWEEEDGFYYDQLRV